MRKFQIYLLSFLLFAYCGTSEESAQEIAEDTTTSTTSTSTTSSTTTTTIIEEEKIVDSPNALEKLIFKNEISFENIHFKYDEQEILNNISFQIPHGETVALVGHSGAGKTTLADLLIRLHDVSSGQITIDGHNIKNINSEQV